MRKQCKHFMPQYLPKMHLTCKLFKWIYVVFFCTGATGCWSSVASISLLHTSGREVHQQANFQRPMWEHVKFDLPLIINFHILVISIQYDYQLFCDIILIVMSIKEQVSLYRAVQKNKYAPLFPQVTTQIKPCHLLVCCPGSKVWCVTSTIPVWTIQHQGRHQAK